MKYIVDFIDTTTDEEINGWLEDKKCKVIKQYDHFAKTYLVETTRKLKKGGIVEHVHLNNTSSSIKLLDTYVADIPLEKSVIDTTDDKNWWKSLIFYNAIQTDVAVVSKIGSGYPVYIMDSGINNDHPDLSNSNVRHLFSFTDDYTDTKGHGTAIASLIAGKEAGITNAEVINVKIFQSGTDTLFSDLLDGLNAIANDYVSNYPSTPGILNISWGIEANDYIESKIKSLINLGIIVVAAAGNSGKPIGDISPARMPEVITIGSINTDLEPSNFSNYTDSSISVTQNDTNYGSELDYWAPGEYIWAANISTNDYSYTAGTSMAAGIFSASLVHNLARHNFRYEMEPMTWHTNEAVLPTMLGDNKVDSTITKENIKELITNVGDMPISGLILPSQALVVLSEKYANCTNKVPVIKALITEELKSAEDIKTDVNSTLYWYRPILFVNKNERVHIPFVNYGFVDSITINNLPEGLSLNGLFIDGTMTEDLGSDITKTFSVDVQFTKEDQTLNTTIFVVYYDRTSIGVDYTEEDLNNEIKQNSNIQLFTEVCFQCCPGCEVVCPGTCIQFWECSAPYKGLYYQECFT